MSNAGDSHMVALLTSDIGDLDHRTLSGGASPAQASAAEVAKQRRWAATKNLVEGVQLLDRSIDTAADLLNEYDPAVAPADGGDDHPGASDARRSSSRLPCRNIWQKGPHHEANEHGVLQGDR